MGIGDVVGMLEHAYYSVISPESCASILWKDPNKKDQAAALLKMQAEDLSKFEIIDTIIEEPLGGAHHNLPQTLKNVETFVLEALALLQKLPVELLLERRYQKFRKMGEHRIESGED